MFDFNLLVYLVDNYIIYQNFYYFIYSCFEYHFKIVDIVYLILHHHFFIAFKVNNLILFVNFPSQSTNLNF